jgi:hypothetical protein
LRGHFAASVTKTPKLEQNKNILLYIFVPVIYI